MALQPIDNGITGAEASTRILANDQYNEQLALSASQEAASAKHEAQTASEAVLEKGPFLLVPGVFTLGFLVENGGAVSTGELAEQYKRNSITANNMYLYNPEYAYFYTGQLSHTWTGGLQLVGIHYQDEAHNFLGFECRGIGAYNRAPLNPPEGTFWIGACSFGADPVIETQKITNKITALGDRLGIIEKNFVVLDQLTAGIAVGGAIRTSGTVDTSVPSYYRTSVANVNMFKYTPGANHFYSGKISHAAYAGVTYFSATFGFLGYEFNEVKTYSREKMSPPAGTVYIGSCSDGTPPVIEVERFDTEGVHTIFVDAASADPAPDGSRSKPYKTISAALSANGSGVVNIQVAAGRYRETLPTGVLRSGRFRIEAAPNKTVEIFGSEAITGWVSVAGYPNVYSAAALTTVPDMPRMGGRLIYEHGRPSKPIEDRHVHPLQRNLSNRLPFTPIVPVASLELVNSTPGSYFIDAGTIYLRPSDPGSPATNGYSYEVPVRSANTITAQASQTQDVTLDLVGIRFMYVLNGFRANGFVLNRRVNCAVIVATSAGAFENAGGRVQTWWEEAAFCNNDGENSHFASAVPGYMDLTDLRSMSPTVEHNYLWSHDNGDDGESSHENHVVAMHNSLLEFNGDSGSRPSNDALYLVTDTLFRGNGWEVTANGTNITPTRGGEGFSVVNPRLNPQRRGCRAYLFNCIFEENNVGLAAISQAENYVEAYNCIGRNNNTELFAAAGAKVVVHNHRVTNANPANIKKVDSGGTITVLNDTLVEP